jgi:hypothetical protein
LAAEAGARSAPVPAGRGFRHPRSHRCAEARGGKPVVFENRIGAAGNLAAAEAAQADPDGYTLFFTAGSVITVNEHIYKRVAFNAERDFVPITNVASAPQVVAVPVSSPYKTLAELIDAAKAQPGKLRFASGGIGSYTSERRSSLSPRASSFCTSPSTARRRRSTTSSLPDSSAS